jgi:hypothetical protein
VQLAESVVVVNDQSGTLAYGVLLADCQVVSLADDDACIITVRDNLTTHANVFFRDYADAKPTLDGRLQLDAAQQVSYIHYVHCFRIVYSVPSTH